MLKRILDVFRMTRQEGGDSHKADVLRRAFSLLYGRPPTPDETIRLQAFGVLNEISDLGAMRRIIAVTDRQTLPTPVIVRFSSEDVIWQKIEDFWIALDRADAAVGDHISGSLYEPHVTAALKRSIRPGMVVADIGANIGYHTLMAARLVGETGRVFAFEPNTENARLILMSRARNRMDWIDLYPLALANGIGYMFFSPFMGSNGGQLPVSEDTLASSQCMVVPTQRLDNLAFSTLDLIKIDVEGGEFSALLGAKETIRSFKPIIISEFSPEMISRISNVNPLEYINSIIGLGYSMALLEKGEDFQERAIPNTSEFVTDFGSLERIEDIIFRPL